MLGKKTIVGLCMACALLVSAFVAQGASAATGTTAFTCASGGTEFADAHCTVAGGAGGFHHVAITEETEIQLTNAGTKNSTTEATNAELQVVSGGIPIKLTATGVSGTGTMLNALNGAEHYAQGEGKITFTGVTVDEPLHCRVKGLPGGVVGTVETNQLIATTKEQGDFLKFEPVAAAGGVFAKFAIESDGTGTCGAAQNPVEIFGSVKGVPNGATTNFSESEVTTQGTLRFGSAKGAKAGLGGSVTISGRKKGTTGAYTPIAATTITT